MAITITASPANKVAEGVHSVYRPIIFTVTSDDGDISRMRCEPTINTIGGVQIGDDPNYKIELDPDLTTSNQFTFDLQDIKFLSSGYVGSNNGGDNMPTLNAIAYSSLYGLLEITRVKFTEIVESSGLLADSATLDSTSGYIVTNNVYNHIDVQDISAKAVDGSLAGGEILTAFTGTKKIGINDSEFAGILLENNFNSNDWNSGSQSLGIQIRTYDSSGAAIDSDSIDLSLSVNSRLFGIGVGPDNLNNATLDFGSQPIIDDQVYTYEVWLSNLTAQRTNKLTFKVDRNCYDNSVRFHWVNKFNVVESFTATGSLTEEEEVNRSRFQRQLVNSEAAQDRGITERQMTIDKTFTVGSGILSRDDSRWLKGLFTSNAVFIQDTTRGSDGYIPVTIENEWELDNDDIQSLEIEFRYSNRDFSQDQ